MIHKVRIQNFKSLRDVSVELERFTVFVGANGSGKTSVLEAILAVVRAATGDPAKVFQQDMHCDRLYTRGGIGDLAIDCATDGGEFSVTASPPEGFLRTPGFLGHGHWNFRVTAGGDTPPDEAIDPAAPLAFLRLNAAQLAKPSYSDRGLRRIRRNGNGLASVLVDMLLNDPDAFAELLRFVRELMPQIKRIRFRRVVIRRRETELIRFDGETIERATQRPYRGEAILFDFNK
jgi:energy-coupling factor transporter ATP-binding protein EcfA2